MKEKEKKSLKKKLNLREDELGANSIAINKRVDILNNIKDKLNNNHFDEAKDEIQDLISSESIIHSITDCIESKFPDFTLSLRNEHP